MPLTAVFLHRLIKTTNRWIGKAIISCSPLGDQFHSTESKDGPSIFNTFRTTKGKQTQTNKQKQVINGIEVNYNVCLWVAV